MDQRSTPALEAASDEISLVDLLAVMLRWRQVIGLALALGLALSGWFAFSELRSGAPRASAVGITAFFFDPVLKTPKPVLESFTANPEFLKALDVMNGAELSDAQINAEYSEAKLELKLTIRSTTLNLDPILASQALTAYIKTYRELPVRSSLFLLGQSSKNLSREQDQPRFDPDERIALEAYALGPAYRVPYVAAWPKKAALAVFASLFLGILAAFMLEYLSRLRSDPESWAKLQASMKGRRG